MNNNMITEDYVSFEIAKLLKERGFDESCTHVYNIENRKRLEADFYTCRYVYNSWLDKNEPRLIAAPTLQVAMKWLREKKNLHIEVYRTACGYLYIISKVPTGSDLYSDGDDYEGDDEDSGQWTTYEKACEAAIKYCLENLI